MTNSYQQITSNTTHDFHINVIASNSLSFRGISTEEKERGRQQGREGKHERGFPSQNDPTALATLIRAKKSHYFLA